MQFATTAHAPIVKIKTMAVMSVERRERLLNEERFGSPHPRARMESAVKIESSIETSNKTFILLVCALEASSARWKTLGRLTTLRDFPSSESFKWTVPLRIQLFAFSTEAVSVAVRLSLGIAPSDIDNIKASVGNRPFASDIASSVLMASLATMNRMAALKNIAPMHAPLIKPSNEKDSQPKEMEFSEPGAISELMSAMITSVGTSQRSRARVARELENLTQSAPVMTIEQTARAGCMETIAIARPKTK